MIFRQLYMLDTQIRHGPRPLTTVFTISAVVPPINKMITTIQATTPLTRINTIHHSYRGLKTPTTQIHNTQSQTYEHLSSSAAVYKAYHSRLLAAIDNMDPGLRSSQVFLYGLVVDHRAHIRIDSGLYVGVPCQHLQLGFDIVEVD